MQHASSWLLVLNMSMVCNCFSPLLHHEWFDPCVRFFLVVALAQFSLADLHATMLSISLSVKLCDGTECKYHLHPDSDGEAFVLNGEQLLLALITSRLELLAHFNLRR